MLATKIGKDVADHLLKGKEEYYLELCKVGIPPISPTVDFLKSIAKQKESLGIKIGVCTGSRRDEVLLHLRHLGIDQMLDIVLSGRDDLSEYSDPEGVNKPKPYIYLDAMKKLGVSPENTIVIEDSTSGIAAGVSAGCITIAIPNAYTQQQDLSQAHMQLDSLGGLEIGDFFQMATRSFSCKKTEKEKITTG